MSTEDGEILTIGKNSLVPTQLFKEKASLIFAERQDNAFLLGTSNNQLFICREDMRLREIKITDSLYLSASVMINAAWVNKDLVALGTLRGGVVFINPNTGETEEIINYNTGLPDNEVYTLTKDRNQNIWATHTYGFTRIAPYLPFRSFRYYSGLQGNLLCAIQFNNDVYVGTSLGLYKLVREEFYDEIVYYVEVPVKKTKTVQRQGDPPPQQPVEVKQESQKGGIFAFLKKKKKAETEETQTVESSPTEKPTTESVVEITYRREKQTKRILRSSHFAYKRIEGIDAKVTQLMEWQGRLLAAGLHGVAEITDKGIVPIIEYPARFLFASASAGKLLISTYDDKIHEMTHVNSKWIEDRLIPGIDDPVNFILRNRARHFGYVVWTKYRVSYETSKPVMSLPVASSGSNAYWAHTIITAQFF